MTLQWFDNGQQELTAFGNEANYVVAHEVRGSKRVWKVTQHLNSTLLKATWTDDAPSGQQLAQHWENFLERHPLRDRDRGTRLRVAARRTRSTRQRLTRSFATQQKGKK